jgi:hypothetical protein
MPRPANRSSGNSAQPAKKAPGRPPKRSYQTAADDFFPPSGLTGPPAEPFAPATEPNTPRPLPIPSPAEGEHSLLDYFAAQALNGLLAGKLAVPNTVLDPTETAYSAYDYAEALLRERARRSPVPLVPVPMPVELPPRFSRPAFADDEMPF